METREQRYRNIASYKRVILVCVDLSRANKGNDEERGAKNTNRS